MCRVSVLNDALNAIMNAERGGKRQVLIRPASKVIIRFLQTMQKHGIYLNTIPLHLPSFHLFPSYSSRLY
jgi:ribosomal protein S8